MMYLRRFLGRAPALDDELRGTEPALSSTDQQQIRHRMESEVTSRRAQRAAGPASPSTQAANSWTADKSD
jgi:hypothetical protein